MTETIGTARLDIVVNTDGMTTGVDAAIRKTREFDGTVKQSAQTQEQASKRAQDATRRAIDQFGKSRDEVLKLQIAQRFTGEEAARLTAKLEAQTAALKRSGAVLNQYGVSAKQQAAALRGVPAQITDIFTSLASGQRPITVLLQQGGQLKDMFGGVVPALRAMGGAVSALINPFTIFGGIAAALFLAFKQGDDEAVGFRQALALTGNTAGVTAGQLQAMAQSLDDGVTTQHEAAAALAEVTKSGKFTADQIRDVADAAIALEKATGQSIDQTVAQFAKLKDDPVKAVVELNDKYHFLTTAVYEQIRALQAQGREEDAVNLAIRESSKQLKARAQEVVENAGFMQRGWMALGAVVRQVWDDIRDAGRASSAVSDAQMKIQSARSQLLANARILREHGAGFTPAQIAEFKRSTETLKKQIQDANKVISDDPGAKKALQDASRNRATALAISLREEADTYKTGLEKLKAAKIKAQGEVDKAVAAARTAGDQTALKLAQDSGKKILSELDKQIADAQKRQDKLPSGGGGGGGRGSASTPRARPAFELDTNGAQQELDRLAQAEQQATESFKDMEAQLQGPLAVAMRDHEKRVAELNALAAQSPEAAERLNAALELEAKRHAEVTKEIEAQNNPLKLLLDDMKFELDLIGKSNAERAVMIELRRQNISAMSDEGQAALQTAKQFEEEAKAKQRSIELMDDFRHGAADALSDIVTHSKSAKDAIRDFFDDLAKRLIQMASERLIERAFGSFGTSGQGTAGGGWLSAIFSMFANAKGNAFQNGQVMAFASGGVVSSPTMFPMKGRMGLMGEAGPEAIMPLTRTADGKLGVRAEGSGSHTVVNNTTFYVPDLSTRYAQQQVADRTQRVQTKSAARNR